MESREDLISYLKFYAHHPTEISSVLDGVSKVYNKEEIVCIFQPHRISRVKNLKIEFSKCFKNANTVLLCPIYKIFIAMGAGSITNWVRNLN